MKLRKAIIGRPTWAEAAAATLQYAEAAIAEHAPKQVTLTFEPVIGSQMPTYALFIRDAR